LVLIAGWLPRWSGAAQGAPAMRPPAWHGHELIYGFVSAFICGFVLTALPSWAETPEISPRPLAFFVLVWVCGRIAAWSYTFLPLPLIGTLDRHGLLIMFAAGAARVGASLIDGGRAWMPVSAFAWAMAFSLFLIEQGGKLRRPSLPRAKPARAGRDRLTF
jgi:uncharacterized protein involved in response to NO